MRDTFNTATGPDENDARGSINGQPITDDTITQLVTDFLNPVGRHCQHQTRRNRHRAPRTPIASTPCVNAPTKNTPAPQRSCAGPSTATSRVDC